jgi:hypothetical protein
VFQTRIVIFNNMNISSAEFILDEVTLGQVFFHYFSFAVLVIIQLMLCIILSSPLEMWIPSRLVFHL